MRVIVGRIFLGALYGGLVLLASYFLYKKQWVPFDREMTGYIAIYFFASGILFDIFKIGTNMIRVGAVTIAFATPFYFGLRHLMHYKHMPYIYLGVGFACFLAFEFRHGFKFKARINTHKTLKEIDSLGNGDTYKKGKQFEEFVCALYRELGYQAFTTGELRAMGKLPAGIMKRGGSGEQGVDVLIKDHINKQVVIVQCKHYSGKVSNSAIQEIHGALALYEAHRAIVVTNQYFTEPAKELAFANKVTLVDRDGLLKMVEYVNGLKKNKKTKIEGLI